MSWSPCGQFLVVGGSGQITVFDDIRFDPTDGAGNVYREIDVIAEGLATDLVDITINTMSGNISLHNPTASAVMIDSYQILSPGGSLNPNGWSSLATRAVPVAGFPLGTGSGNGWEVGPSASSQELVEWYLDDEEAPSSLADAGITDRM